MPEALRYYLAAQLAAAAFLPFAARLFRRSPDRGWALAKPLGVFAFALADRWLFAAGLVDAAPTARSRILLLLLLAAAAAHLVEPRRRRRLGALLSRRGRELALIEAAFAVAFAGALLLRALDPGVLHTEQPMDLMQLANELDAPAWPPLDPWLAGVPVGYYTLGHAAAAALARLAVVPAEVAYNLALAAWFALAVAGLGWRWWRIRGSPPTCTGRCRSFWSSPLTGWRRGTSATAPHGWRSCWPWRTRAACWSRGAATATAA